MKRLVERGMDRLKRIAERRARGQPPEHLWVTKENVVMKISEMETSHLNNVMRMLERNSRMEQPVYGWIVEELERRAVKDDKMAARGTKGPRGMAVGKDVP